MILEIAEIRIPPGRNDEFDAAIKHGIETVVSKAEGYRLHRVVKGIESPERYMLMIWWETLEDHTVKFRGGPLFPQWRAIVGPFLRRRRRSSALHGRPPRGLRIAGVKRRSLVAVAGCLAAEPRCCRRASSPFFFFSKAAPQPPPRPRPRRCRCRASPYRERKLRQRPQRALGREPRQPDGQHPGLVPGRRKRRPGRQVGIRASLRAHDVQGLAAHAERELDRLTEDVGGQNNTFTAEDVTAYQAVVPSNHLQPLLWAEAERLASLRSMWPIPLEREVVKEEYRQRSSLRPTAAFSRRCAPSPTCAIPTGAA